MDSQLEEFLSTIDDEDEKQQRAFVLPVYEVDTKDPDALPADKRDLLTNYIKVL